MEKEDVVCHMEDVMSEMAREMTLLCTTENINDALNESCEQEHNEKDQSKDTSVTMPNGLVRNDGLKASVDANKLQGSTNDRAANSVAKCQTTMDTLIAKTGGNIIAAKCEAQLKADVAKMENCDTKPKCETKGKRETTVSSRVAKWEAHTSSSATKRETIGVGETTELSCNHNIPASACESTQKFLIAKREGQEQREANISKTMNGSKAEKSEAKDNCQDATREASEPLNFSLNCDNKTDTVLLTTHDQLVQSSKQTPENDLNLDQPATATATAELLDQNANRKVTAACENSSLPVIAPQSLTTTPHTVVKMQAPTLQTIHEVKQAPDATTRSAKCDAPENGPKLKSVTQRIHDIENGLNAGKVQVCDGQNIPTSRDAKCVASHHVKDTVINANMVNTVACDSTSIKISDTVIKGESETSRDTSNKMQNDLHVISVDTIKGHSTPADTTKEGYSTPVDTVKEHSTPADTVGEGHSTEDTVEIGHSTVDTVEMGQSTPADTIDINRTEDTTDKSQSLDTSKAEILLNTPMNNIPIIKVQNDSPATVIKGHTRSDTVVDTVADKCDDIPAIVVTDTDNKSHLDNTGHGVSSSNGHTVTEFPELLSRLSDASSRSKNSHVTASTSKQDITTSTKQPANLNSNVAVSNHKLTDSNSGSTDSNSSGFHPNLADTSTRLTDSDSTGSHPKLTDSDATDPKLTDSNSKLLDSNPKVVVSGPVFTSSQKLDGSSDSPRQGRCLKTPQQEEQDEETDVLNDDFSQSGRSSRSNSLLPPSFLAFQASLARRRGSMTSAAPPQLLVHDKKAEWTQQRTVAINGALDWIKTQLQEMRNEDQELARTLVELHHGIREVKLQRCCDENREALDDAMAGLLEDDQHGLLTDDVMPGPLSPVLKDIGLTRMNITIRRFSVF